MENFTISSHVIIRPILILSTCGSVFYYYYYYYQKKNVVQSLSFYSLEVSSIIHLNFSLLKKTINK